MIKNEILKMPDKYHIPKKEILLKMLGCLDYFSRFSKTISDLELLYEKKSEWFYHEDEGYLFNDLWDRLDSLYLFLMENGKIFASKEACQNIWEKNKIQATQGLWYLVKLLKGEFIKKDFPRGGLRFCYKFGFFLNNYVQKISLRNEKKLIKHRQKWVFLQKSFSSIKQLEAYKSHVHLLLSEDNCPVIDYFKTNEQNDLRIHLNHQILKWNQKIEDMLMKQSDSENLWENEWRYYLFEIYWYWFKNMLHEIEPKDLEIIYSEGFPKPTEVV